MDRKEVRRSMEESVCERLYETRTMIREGTSVEDMFRIFTAAVATSGLKSST